MVKFLTWLFILAVVVGVVVLSNPDLKIKSDLISGSSVNEDIINGGAKVFAVTADSLRFWIDGIENPDIVVRKGDTVRINFVSTEGFHDWGVDEFNATTKRVSQGESTFIEFVANEKGTFAYYCSVGNHRLAGMEGKFIVK